MDGLKKVNDTYGHDQGDELLKTFVKIAKNNIRETDYVIRMGGDEFIIVLSNTKDSKKVMKRIKEIYNKETKQTFSYGIEKIQDFKNSYKKADRKMYNMKRESKKLLNQSPENIT